MCNVRALKLVGILVAALSMGACAKNPADNPSLANASAAVPGSQQDFVVNVGDRVFFESDSSELTPQSTGTLEKQAQWLRSYPQYAFLI
ncbi:MAG: peptidoglycan-associated lipoprotein, partial [Xanthobacteraceae bacterium]